MARAPTKAAPPRKSRASKGTKGSTKPATPAGKRERSYAPSSSALTSGHSGFEKAAELLPDKADRVDIPPPPNTDDRVAAEEQQVVRVEQLMLKGFTDRGQLCTLLGVTDIRSMDRYIKKVHARWEYLGSANDLKRSRGEALRKVRLLQAEMWVVYQNAKDDPRVGVVTLQAIQNAMEHENKLKGLTEKQIAVLNQQTGDTPLTMRLREHRGMSEVAGRFLERFAERSAAIPEGTVSGEIIPPAPVPPGHPDHVDQQRGAPGAVHPLQRPLPPLELGEDEDGMVDYGHHESE